MPLETVTVTGSCVEFPCVSEIVKAQVPAACGVTVKVAPLIEIVAKPPLQVAGAAENVPV